MLNLFTDKLVSVQSAVTDASSNEISILHLTSSSGEVMGNFSPIGEVSIVKDTEILGPRLLALVEPTFSSVSVHYYTTELQNSYSYQWAH